MKQLALSSPQRRRLIGVDGRARSFNLPHMSVHCAACTTQRRAHTAHTLHLPVAAHTPGRGEIGNRTRRARPSIVRHAARSVHHAAPARPTASGVSAASLACGASRESLKSGTSGPSEGENGRLKIDVAENIRSLLHFHRPDRGMREAVPTLLLPDRPAPAADEREPRVAARHDATGSRLRCVAATGKLAKATTQPAREHHLLRSCSRVPKTGTGPVFF
jgi:hypothetical protein